MAEIAHKPATYADLEAVPPHLVAESIFGTLVTHPRPTTEHGAASTSLADEIVGPIQKGRGGPGGRDDVCAPPFEAITFSLGLLWPFDPPAPNTSVPQS